ncbi:hypothetical protein AQUCO_02400129v1 [Aquilegia coerulea]|uniref:Protein kinase domain-containing protein n=1 Tax=Aquilegia coerulea TaxID=218851 RepID=A0A2G5DBG0_AQUCA|nr:hypothetical protein AQUCO_02400129v1 [Aquilegia coerulea]
MKIVIIIVVCYKIGQREDHTVIVAAGFMSYPKYIVPDYMEREMPIRFSSKELRTVTNNFTNLLSAGGCGAVYKGISSSGQSVAVKIINGSSDKRMVEQFMEELDTIGRIHHPNLVHLYGFCFERDVRALVYEYEVIGSLDRFLTHENMTIGFMKLHEIAVGTAKGIAYLHEECQLKIIHYDIKPENILLDARFVPKVANFGSVKLCNKDSIHVMSGGSWTPGYFAPELWLPFPVTRKCDVYSFGMVLTEIIKSKKADINLPESQEWFPNWVWNKFVKGELVDILTICGIEEKDREMAERMVKVALWCVQYAPESRPSMSLVVKMLDGRMNIPTPTNPFPHLTTVTPPNLINGTSSTGNRL